MLARRRVVLGAALAWMLAAADGSAQQATKRLSLVEAIDAALNADPAVAAAGAEVASARAAVGETKSALRLHVDVSGSLVQYEEPMVVTPIHGFTPGQFPEFDRTLIQSNVAASYLLYDGGASRARVRQASAGQSAAAAALDAARKAVAAKTAALYLTVLSHAATLEAHDRRTAALEAELDRVKKLREVGRAANVEVLRVEAALASAASERTSTSADLDLAERSLARMAGLPVPQTRAPNLQPTRLDTSVIADRTELERQALDSSPTVRQSRETLLAQRAAISFARAGGLPRLQALGSLLEFGSAAGEFSTEWNTGIQVRWSAFDGGAAKERVAQAKAAAERAEQQVRLTEKDVRDAIDRSLADFERARATADSLRTAVDRFEEVVRIEKLRLEAGAGTQTDYLRAEADLIQVRAGLAAARYRSMMALVEIARITGQLDSAWLAEMTRSE